MINANLLQWTPNDSLSSLKLQWLWIFMIPLTLE